ncbi:hypothetical protein ACFPM7_00230 [Actinokineospora guangxiensis]|uniref:Uncharacterized protein n=1 Tax=Actinokineospora guangxiensis TaxID=1490288 RepID=A0ABW0EDI6_9PSEU
MTDWLDQIQRLDRALTAGEITSAQHRSRRDEILAEASSQSQLQHHGPRHPAPVPAAAPPLAASPLAGPAITGPATAPPLVTPSEASAIFSTAPSTLRKPWLAPVAVLAVLALVAAGIWVWMLSAPGEPGAPPPQAAPPAPPALTELRLPGEADARSGTMSLAEAREENLITAAETALLGEVGVAEITYVGSADKPYQYLVFAYPSADPAGQTDKLVAAQSALGFTEAEVPGLPDGVRAAELGNERAAQARLTYATATGTVQALVLQVPRGDRDDLLARLGDVAGVVVGAAPPR